MEKNKKHLTPEEIAMAVDYQADNRYTELPDEIRKHLRDCDSCAAEFLSLAQIASEEDSESDAVRRTKEPKIKWMYPVIRAAAIILVLVGIYFLFPKEKHKHSPGISELNDSLTVPEKESRSQQITRKITKKDSPVSRSNQATEKIEAAHNKKQELLLAFNENKEFENQFIRFSKESAFRALGFEMISPHEIRLEKPGPFTLKWNYPDQKCQVLLFDNRGNEIEANTATNQVQIKNIRKIGLYYYKILDEDYNLLYCGKVYCGRK